MSLPCVVIPSPFSAVIKSYNGVGVGVGVSVTVGVGVVVGVGNGKVDEGVWVGVTVTVGVIVAVIVGVGVGDWVLNWKSFGSQTSGLQSGQSGLNIENLSFKILKLCLISGAVNGET